MEMLLGVPRRAGLVLRSEQKIGSNATSEGVVKMGVRRPRSHEPRLSLAARWGDGCLTRGACVDALARGDALQEVGGGIPWRHASRAASSATVASRLARATLGRARGASATTFALAGWGVDTCIGDTNQGAGNAIGNTKAESVQCASCASGGTRDIDIDANDPLNVRQDVDTSHRTGKKRLHEHARKVGERHQR